MRASEVMVNHFLSSRVCSVRTMPEFADQVNADAAQLIAEVRKDDAAGTVVATLMGDFAGQAHDIGFRPEVAIAWFEERNTESWKLR